MATSKLLPAKLLRSNLPSTVLASRRTAQPLLDEVVVASATIRLAPSARSADGVPREHIAFEPGVADLLQQQPVRGGAPVVLEAVADHHRRPCVYITATPEPLWRNVFSTYWQPSEYMKCSP